MALKNYSLFERPVMQKLPVADFLIDFIALIRNDFEKHHIMLNLITTPPTRLATARTHRSSSVPENHGTRWKSRLKITVKG